MGGLLGIALGIMGAAYYFLMRATGNKEAAESDDVAGGAAWIVVMFATWFALLLILSIVPFEVLDQPYRSIVGIGVAIIGLYLMYKIPCILVPTKDDNDSRIKHTQTTIPDTTAQNILKSGYQNVS